MSVFTDVISIDYGGTTYALNRINDDGYSSEYRHNAAQLRFHLSVKHDLKKAGQSGESHLVRLDVEHYTPEGAYIRTSSAWVVIKTVDGTQDDSSSESAATALLGFLQASTAVADVVDGIS